ncbi:ATP-binding protein [Nocardia niwae]|uniref:AAA family ATPase n=1 Tax=Nocardia niwae TaxID=626084 RepID=A0ABV2XAL3_9NOCA|nr:AAA family ATPase [Nocardia niwae]
MSEVNSGGGNGLTAPVEFVGRQAELRRIHALLDSSNARLITLVGPGGIGKTTLAVEAVRRYRGAARHTVYWTRLARLAASAETGAVAEEVLLSVAKNGIAGRSAWDGLLEVLTEGAPDDGPHRTILVLDNCEHVLGGVGPLVVGLLQEVPGLTIVATSREPIGWIDEHLVTVPPLSSVHALELFRRRAERTGRPIPEEPGQLAIATRICGHVDNNPLFIRLAAARLLHRPPAILLRELSGDTDDRRLQWTHGARGGVGERHRSVRDVIAWSYGLCTAPEQLLLDRLSVFATGCDAENDETQCGGAEVDAIVAVCADAALPAERIEGLLERLVERSLLSVHLTAATVRYYLLESVRVFVRDRLATRGDHLDEARLLARHRRHYRDRVAAGPATWYGPREQEWIDWARAAWDNILIAVETSLADPEEAVVGLETAATLMALRVPFITGSNRAITNLTEQALEVTAQVDPPPTRLRINATALVGWIAIWQGRHAYTAQLLDECAAECLEPQLRRRWRETTAIDAGLPAAVEFTWGLELLLIHLDLRAVDVLSRAREKFAALGDRAGEQRSELFGALTYANLGDADVALAAAREHLDRAVASDAGWATSWAELAWMIAVSRHGDPREAVKLGQSTLERLLVTGDTWTAGWVAHFIMMALTYLLSARIEAGDTGSPAAKAAATEIAHLQGGIATLHRSMGIVADRVTLVARGTARAVAAVTAVIGEQAHAAAVQRGARLRPERDELQLLLLGRLPVDQLPNPRPQNRSTASRWEELTPAEREVAVLAAAGWANSAIAARRGSSIRTVDAQVASVRRKLMAATRADIGWHVPDDLAERIRLESERRPARTRTRP